MSVSAVPLLEPEPSHHRAALATSPLWDRIWTADWDDVEALELVPGFSLRTDVWCIPERWASGGIKGRRSNRTIDFARCLPPSWCRSEPRSEHAIRRLKRLASLFFLRILRIGRRVGNPPKPSTWVSYVHGLLRAARVTLSEERRSRLPAASTCPDGTPIFSDMAPTEMAALVAKEAVFGSAVVPRLNALLAAEAFDDWPAVDVAAPRCGSEEERPYSDDFTSAVGHAAVWIMEVLGPDLVACWTQFRALRSRSDGGRRTADIEVDRRAWLDAWRGSTLGPGLTFPYAFKVRAHNGKVRTSAVCAAWPPPGGFALRDLVSLLQAAHMVVLALAAAPRDGELAGLARDCLDELWDRDLLLGHTFKQSPSAQGQARRWPLPKAAVRAIDQQRALAGTMAPRNPGLWVPMGTSGDGVVRNCTSNIVSFCERVLMPDGRSLAEFCDGAVNVARFRKTAVRLASLCLVGANQILLDVLGHCNGGTTLGYILSDPDLQDDMRLIAHEAAVALAKEALQSPEGNGGPAAPAVKHMADRLAPRSGEKELDVRRLSFAAEILCQGGRVMLVRPNVLCTKTFDQAGPCSRRAGHPDIGNCQGDCTHRLELAAAKADHRRAIMQILDEMPRDDGMMRAWWQAQLLSHLAPFADLRQEMLSDRRVRVALVGVPQRSIDMLDERHRDAARGLAGFA